MKTFLIVGWLLLVSSTTGFSEAARAGMPLDSVKQEKTKPIRWALNLDFRNSFVNRQPVNVWGVNSGIVLGRNRHQITLGYYWLSYSSYLRLINWHRNAARRLNLAYYTKTDMAYGSLMFWPNIINNRRWMFSLPVEMGAGKASAVTTDTRTDTLKGRSHWDFFMPLQVGAYSQWKASRWVGLNAQVGYRYSLFQTNVDQHYNGMYYSFGTVIYTEFFKDIWGYLRHRKWPKGSLLDPPGTL
ncbi:hypothetical protein ACFPMF_01905 [Larkinella bovis]|uniref:DUF2490 domain-containing protein n=1 Tax=Larkinella bovis TaxID=683041 RepID=A0ABW0I6K8_9BACT